MAMEAPGYNFGGPSMPTNAPQVQQLPPQFQTALDMASIKRALASAMMQRGSQPLQSSTVQTGGGAPNIVVRPSPWQGISEMASMYLGGNMLKQSQDEMTRAMVGYQNMHTAENAKLANPLAPLNTSGLSADPQRPVIPNTAGGADPTEIAASAPGGANALQDTRGVTHPLPMITDQGSLLRAIQEQQARINIAGNSTDPATSSKLPAFIEGLNKLQAQQAAIDAENQRQRVGGALEAAKPEAKLKFAQTGNPADLEQIPAMNTGSEIPGTNGQVAAMSGGTQLVQDPKTRQITAGHTPQFELDKVNRESANSDLNETRKELSGQQPGALSSAYIANVAAALKELAGSGQAIMGPFAGTRAELARYSAWAHQTFSPGATYHDIMKGLAVSAVSQAKTMSGIDQLRSTKEWQQLMEISGADLANSPESYVTQFENVGNLARAQVQNYNRQTESAALRAVGIGRHEAFTNLTIGPDVMPPVQTGLPGTPGAIPQARPMPPSAPAGTPQPYHPSGPNSFSPPSGPNPALQNPATDWLNRAQAANPNMSQEELLAEGIKRGKIKRIGQ